jgi:hypothetical protein
MRAHGPASHGGMGCWARDCCDVKGMHSSLEWLGGQRQSQTGCAFAQEVWELV